MKFVMNRFFCVVLAAFILSCTAPVAGEYDIRDSMVKVYTVQSHPDYDNPWNTKSPDLIYGSGCVIDGERILTNAHVVSNRTFVQARLHGHPQKYAATVEAISHEADLALLRVENNKFFKSAQPLKLGDLPETQEEIVVYGFPEGGDALSTTKGVVSRIEQQEYVHSGLWLLAIQVDAAVNAGNSGGPAVSGGKIVGVVMQGLKDADNISYLVPADVIKHFLKDIADGRYNGFPDDGIIYQSMESKDLRRSHRMDDQQSGVLVMAVSAASNAARYLESGDVIQVVDGHPVANDGTVEFRKGERTEMDLLTKNHQVGDEIQMHILRSGKGQDVKFRLGQTAQDNMLIPMDRYDVKPTYYIYGGLVFAPLTMNYIKTWDQWRKNAPDFFLAQLWMNWRTKERDQVAILQKVLPAKVNRGYHLMRNCIITAVNGRKISGLRELMTTVEAHSAGDFVKFRTLSGELIVLDCKQAETANAKILETYSIPSDRSEDLLEQR